MIFVTLYHGRDLATYDHLFQVRKDIDKFRNIQTVSHVFKNLEG